MIQFRAIFSKKLALFLGLVVGNMTCWMCFLTHWTLYPCSVFFTRI